MRESCLGSPSVFLLFKSNQCACRVVVSKLSRSCSHRRQTEPKPRGKSPLAVKARDLNRPRYASGSIQSVFWGSTQIAPFVELWMAEAGAWDAELPSRR
jgi:hypothetical protein